MTHLKIEQNNGVIEEVSSAVIDKLYDIVHSGNLDNTSNLIGRLHTSATYQDYIDYLEDAFKVDGVKLLIIDATKKYMSFADPVVASYWANSSYGDGTGIDNTAASSVLSIPANAFKDNTSILTFDELVKFTNCTTILSNAFLGCTNLTSIDLHNITYIYGHAFENSGISGIIDLTSVLTIEGASFSLCSNITEVHFGPNFTTIYGWNVFSGCTGLTTVTGFEYKAGGTGMGTFNGCTNLTSISLGSGITSLGDGTFQNCTNLEYIPGLKYDTNSSAMTGTFKGCSKLKCVYLDFDTDILDQTFSGCSSLEDLTTNDPSNINTGEVTYTINCTLLKSGAFSGCKLTNKNFIFPNLTTISGWGAFSGIKAKSFNAPLVTTLGADFCSNASFLTVSIPSVIEIPSSSFSKCSSLTSIVCTNTTTIGLLAFQNCTSLSSIDLSNVQSIGRLAFASCTSLTSVDLSSATTFGTEIFNGCTSLLSVVLNSSLTTLPNGMFFGCSALTTINAENIEDLSGGSTFRKCTSLVSIDISSCTNIGAATFLECSALTTVKLGNNLTTIGNAAFWGCNALTTIQVPAAKLSDYQTAFPDLASKMVAY